MEAEQKKETLQPEAGHKTLMQESFDELMDSKMVKMFDRLITSPYGIYWLPLLVLNEMLQFH